MRRSWPVAALLLLVLLTGCQLEKKSNDCVNQPGLTTGGTSACSKPPPTDFNQLGN